jgi:hypothetical protein
MDLYPASSHAFPNAAINSIEFDYLGSVRDRHRHVYLTHFVSERERAQGPGVPGPPRRAPT